MLAFLLFLCIIVTNRGIIKIMIVVKDINKLILKKVLEIVFVFCFLLISTFLWRSKNAQLFSSAISTFSNLNYTNIKVDSPIEYTMFPMDDQDAMQNLKPCIVSVRNETYTLENYTLILKIDKNSTMDYQFLNIGIDNTIYTLKDLFRQEEDNYYIFVLDTDQISGNIKKYEIRVWLNNLADNNMQSKDLIMNFDLKHETTMA